MKIVYETGAMFVKINVLIVTMSYLSPITTTAYNFLLGFLGLVWILVPFISVPLKMLEEEKRNTAKEKKKENKGYPYKNKKIRDKAKK